MLNTNIKNIIPWLLVILWIGVIFSFSSDPAEVSQGKSQIIFEKVEPVVVKIADEIGVSPISKDELHFYVRKNAHAFNYFVLTVLGFIAFRSLELTKMKCLIGSCLLSTEFAMLDEFYQTFIPGRSGQVSDVLVDCLGIVIGVFVILIAKMY